MYIFFHAIYYLRPLVLLPLSRNSDPGSHRARLFSTRARALHLNFYREKDSALSSLVDSRRIVPTHTLRISGALDSCCHLKIKSSIRRFGPVTSTLCSGITTTPTG